MTGGEVPSEVRAFLVSAYDVFNRRDIDAALEMMTLDVEWPNGMEGGFVHGREEVRAYWTRQWELIDPHVEPEQIGAESDGRYAVDVSQTIRNRLGQVLNERSVVHVWSFRGGLAARMEIRES